MPLTARIARFLLLLLLAAGVSVECASAQTRPMVRLSGHVLERTSHEPIPGASLALVGTSRGARANRDGAFTLLLKAGTRYRIRVTAIGYRPDTITGILTSDTTRSIALDPAPVTGAIITVAADASRREARRIIQKVIDSKDAWQSEIHDYQFGVYARTNVRSGKDTTTKVLAVLESSAEGYWKQGKGYAERILARKQTANFPADANRAALFDVDNFYNERIDFDEYSVTGPVAHDAFDRYDYDLIGEGQLNGASVYKIAVEPRGDVIPAFRGTLWVDKADYTIAYLELSPNEAVKLGPVKDILITQTFGPVEGKYWMPSQLQFGFTIKLDLPIIPRFRFEQSAVLESYIINGGLADSLFDKRHTVAARADSADSSHWASLRAIPLATDEARAYRTFSSIAARSSDTSSHGILDRLLGVLSPDYAFDRVEGSRLELSASGTVSSAWPLTLDGMIAYGLGDRRWKYSAEATQGLTWSTRPAMNAEMSLDGDISFGAPGTRMVVTRSVAARVFDDVERHGAAYSPFVNTLTALLLHSDYPDYYRARGAAVTYLDRSQRGWSASLTLTSQDESSLAQVTDASFLTTASHYRDVPAITAGRLRSIRLSVEHTDRARAGWGLDGRLTLEDARSAYGSDFTFTTLSATASLEGKAGVLGRSWLRLSFDDRVSGVLPPQHRFVIESRNAVLAGREVFQTASPLEFQTDHLWTASFEQNLYDLPTRLVGLSMPLDLHWFAFANVAGGALNDGVPPSTPLAEVGGGIGNILQVIRLDVTWRLTHRTPPAAASASPVVTGTLAVSF